MLMVVFGITVTVFVFLSTVVLATLAVFALKRFNEWVDRTTWNYMFQHKTKKWRRIKKENVKLKG